MGALGALAMGAYFAPKVKLEAGALFASFGERA
jgi:hypothetical protein